MSQQQQPVNLRLFNPTLDVLSSVGTDGKPEDRLVIRGVIDPTTIKAILVGPYQRHVLGGGKSSALQTAAKSSLLPDVELGMRGSAYQERSLGGDAKYYLLQDPVYVIDGLQRIAAVTAVMDEAATTPPKLGAVIHVDTTQEWEVNRFRILNQERTRLSPAILLRNGREQSPGIDVLYRLTTEDRGFVLCGRVCWEQRMKRDELLQALKFCRVVSVLHSRFSAGMSEDVRVLGSNLDRQRDVVGHNIFRDNVRTFYQLIQDLWGITNVTYRERAPQLKGGFMNALALLFSEVDEFWNGYRLVLNARQRKKLGKFPIMDTSVAGLCGGGGSSTTVLLETMKHHINSGRRINRIISEPENGGE